MTTMGFGFLAVPADAPGTSDADLYATLMDSCAFHRDLGYRTAWLIEHHFSDYYPCPSPTVLMAHIAARFDDLDLGTCVLVAPWYDPLRLAGELAMLSNLTDRRLYIGLGRGTAKYEYDAYGLDMTEARQRFQETWEVLDRAIDGEPFTYDGTYLHVGPTVRIRPRPARDRIEFLGAIGSAASTGVMAELGLAPMCTSFGALTPELLPAWTARARELGTIDSVSRLRPLMINTIVADTDAEAVAEAQELMPRFMEAQVKHYGAHHVEIGAVKGYEAWVATFERWKALCDPANIPSWCEHQLIGSPETVARRVEGFAANGFNHLILHTVTPGARTTQRGGEPLTARRAARRRPSDRPASRRSGAAPPLRSHATASTADASRAVAS